jgi:hypothetical protein
MPKSTRPRNAAEAENRAFLSVKHRFWRDICDSTGNRRNRAAQAQTSRSSALGEKS